MHKVLHTDGFRTSVFEGLKSNQSDAGWFTLRAILSTKNSRLIEINTKVGSMFPGSFKTFLSAGTVEEDDQNSFRYPVEVLNCLHGRLDAKAPFSTQIWFTIEPIRNFCPHKGRMNGVRCIVEHLSSHLHLKVAVICT